MTLRTSRGVVSLFLSVDGGRAGNYTNFDVAIYIPVNVVQSFADPQKLADDWSRISRQLKVDKVYIEVQRDRRLADGPLLEHVKRFFLDHGVKVAGGMASAASSHHSATRMLTTASSSGLRRNWRRGILTRSSRTISF